MSTILLTAAEVAELTDTPYPAYQERWLIKHGWRYERSKRIKIARSYFEWRMGARVSAAPGDADVEPNFAAMMST